MSTRDYWLAAVSSSLTIALNYTYATVIGQLLVPYGNTQVEFLGILVNLFGIVGAAILAVTISKTGLRFLRADQAITCCTLVALVLFWIFEENETACYFTVALLGFVNIPIYFTAYELAVEQSCSDGVLGEATPCGVINMLGNGLASVEIFALTPILSRGDVWGVNVTIGIMMGVQILACGMIALVRMPKQTEDSHRS